MKDLKAFCEKYNLTEAQATGKEKIYGSLYLSSVTTIPDGFNPTVGGWLYLRSGEKYIGASVPDVYFWRDKKYIKADGIFQEMEDGRTAIHSKMQRRIWYSRFPIETRANMKAFLLTTLLPMRRQSYATELLRVLVLPAQRVLYNHYLSLLSRSHTLYERL